MQKNNTEQKFDLKSWHMIIMITTILFILMIMSYITTIKIPINKDYQIYTIWKVYKNGNYYYSIDYIDGEMIKSIEVNADNTPIYYSNESKMTWNYHTKCNGFCSPSTIIDSVTLYVSEKIQVKGASSQYISGMTTENSVIERIY